MKYLPIIGLEVHVELKTKSKMFCGCSANWFGVKPNTLTCPVCLGLPGALPVINKKALEMTARLGLALHGRVEPSSYFERKNYFYPDLPKGYQISQYRAPLCRGGYLEVDGRKIRINRVHQEEDTAKLVHCTDPKADGQYTLVDFNRSGVPLTEIVTEPDIHSAEEAKKYLRQLRRLIRYLDISDADMEKGSMRLEANISLKKLDAPSSTPRLRSAEEKSSNSPEPGSEDSLEPGSFPSSSEESAGLRVDSDLPNYRVEIKNINSFRFVEKAINYEIARQTEALEKGEKLVQETRGWNEKKQETFLQRTKEEARDYRYFPEPDLPPMEFSEEWAAEVRKQIPELPDEKSARLIKQYGIENKVAQHLVETAEMAEFFTTCSGILSDVLHDSRKPVPVLVANWIINRPDQIKGLTPQEVANKILREQTQETIGAQQLEALAQKTILENESTVADYKKGKTNAIQFLLGQLMRRAEGKVDPAEARKLLEELLARTKVR